MGVGYASISSILEIGGEIILTEVEGIYITETKYVSDVNADVSSSKILKAYQTNLDSHIVLSNTDPNSSITYEVTIYNSSENDYFFINTNYMLGDYTYDNEDISFKLDVLAKNDILESKKSITFRITFYYSNNTVSTNNELKSILNFKFDLPGTLINNNSAKDLVFGRSMPKSEIETIYTLDNIDIPETAIATWDATQEQNGTITAWILMFLRFFRFFRRLSVYLLFFFAVKRLFLPCFCAFSIF